MPHFVTTDNDLRHGAFTAPPSVSVGACRDDAHGGGVRHVQTKTKLSRGSCDVSEKKEKTN